MIAEGFIVFISGMARGVDIWAAEIVIKLRDEEHLPIKLIAASPFEGFEERWPEEWRKRYHKVLEKADLIRYISPHYYTGCFQVRNEWMVDHSAIVIAVWNGEKSGTANMVSYANHQQIDVINVL